jgi:hypothetical protein
LIKALAAGDVGTNNVKVVAFCKETGDVLQEITASVVADPVLSPCTWTPEASKFYKGQTANAKATLSNSYSRCGTNGEKTAPGFPRELVVADVGTNLAATVSVTCTAAGYGPLTSACQASPTVGDGKIGGGTDTPFELVGNGNLPSANELSELGGILYLNGFGRANNRTIECNPNMNNVQQINTCDFRSGDCTPNDKCGGPFSNGNGDCQFPQGYFISTNPSDGNYCNNNNCEYKIKIEFVLKTPGSTYPTCKIR